MLPRVAVAVLAATAVTTVRPSRADPVEDFQAATTAEVRMATINVGGFTSTGNIPVGKRSGTLDLALEARQVGIPLPITIHLRGSTRGGNRITYAIDDRYSPAVDVGNGQRLSRVTGRLEAVASWFPGAARPDIGNVKVTLIGTSSSVVATVDGKPQSIGIVTLDVVGGLLQPALASFGYTGRLACSDKVPTRHAFSVTLAGDARTNGAPVHLDTPLRSGIHVPSAILVPKGRRVGKLIAIVDPGFVGTVRVTASAGGTSRTLDLPIHDHRDCE